MTNSVLRYSIAFLLIFTIMQCSDAFAQRQLGIDIDGEAAGDLSGYSVSLSADGSVLAVGAPLNDSNGNDSGLYRLCLFQYNGYQKRDILLPKQEYQHLAR